MFEICQSVTWNVYLGRGKSTKQIFIKPAWLYKLAVRLWVNLIACLKQYVISEHDGSRKSELIEMSISSTFFSSLN